MKRFVTPRMALVHLVNDDIICASGDCVANYCDGFTCPQCEDHENCPVQTECTQYQCPHYLCPQY